MLAKNTQHLLTRVRPPRVKITYDIETEGSAQKVEIPFIILVISHLGGTNAQTNLEKMECINVQKDNFDKIMRDVDSQLSLVVENKIANDGSRVAAPLRFHSMDDFEPYNILTQVPEFADALFKMQSLKEILIKMDGNIRFETMLNGILKNKSLATEILNSVKSALNAK